MKCPYCRHLCDSDFELCPNCNARLYSGPSEFNPPRGFAESAATEVVFRSSDPLEAQLVATALADANIPYSLYSEMADGTRFTSLEHAWTPGHQTLLAVPVIASNEARDVLRQLAFGCEPPMSEGHSASPSHRHLSRTMAIVVLFVIALPVLIAIIGLLASFFGH